MKEVHIVTVDGRIIDVFALKHHAEERWRGLKDAAKVVDQLNDHEIFVVSKEVK